MSTTPSVLVVVLTGVSLVFAILVLLTLVITVQGKIFSSIEKKKNAQAAQKIVAAAPVVKAAPAAPVIEAGISPEVIAAITAAIMAMGGGKYTLRSLTRAKGVNGPWAVAATITDTDPF